MLDQLNCQLTNHDTNEVTTVSMNIQSQDWRVIFDYMVNVYCREPQFELIPVSITWDGETLAEYEIETASMVEIDEEEL